LVAKAIVPLIDCAPLMLSDLLVLQLLGAAGFIV
jgi:hypothetical protein